MVCFRCDYFGVFVQRLQKWLNTRWYFSGIIHWSCIIVVVTTYQKMPRVLLLYVQDAFV